ncbi:unnamed protein product [Ambrosiozyma monospora]|uniref:Unnamed protein product n=1 Tax=Ambrosiozyma monospora TaxID=43982 RepID=A0A9W7DHM3_AMBMO|nr:unnamed protein product [Ambrosiozyma monospora]
MTTLKPAPVPNVKPAELKWSAAVTAAAHNHNNHGHSLSHSRHGSISGSGSGSGPGSGGSSQKSSPVVSNANARNAASVLEALKKQKSVSGYGSPVVSPVQSKPSQLAGVGSNGSGAVVTASQTQTAKTIPSAAIGGGRSGSGTSSKDDSSVISPSSETDETETISKTTTTTSTTTTTNNGNENLETVELQLNEFQQKVEIEAERDPDFRFLPPGIQVTILSFAITRASASSTNSSNGSSCSTASGTSNSSPNLKNGLKNNNRNKNNNNNNNNKIENNNNNNEDSGNGNGSKIPSSTSTMSLSNPYKMISIPRSYSSLPSTFQPPSPLEFQRCFTIWNSIRRTPQLSILKNLVRGLDTQCLFFGYYFELSDCERRLCFDVLCERGWKCELNSTGGGGADCGMMTTTTATTCWFQRVDGLLIGGNVNGINGINGNRNVEGFEVGDFNVFDAVKWTLTEKKNFKLELNRVISPVVGHVDGDNVDGSATTVAVGSS